MQSSNKDSLSVYCLCKWPFLFLGQVRNRIQCVYNTAVSMTLQLYQMNFLLPISNELGRFLLVPFFIKTYGWEVVFTSTFGHCIGKCFSSSLRELKASSKYSSVWGPRGTGWAWNHILHLGAKLPIWCPSESDLFFPLFPLGFLLGAL